MHEGQAAEVLVWWRNTATDPESLTMRVAHRRHDYMAFQREGSGIQSPGRKHVRRQSLRTRKLQQRALLSCGTNIAKQTFWMQLVWTHQNCIRPLSSAPKHCKEYMRYFNTWKGATVNQGCCIVEGVIGTFLLNKHKKGSSWPPSYHSRSYF